MKPVLFNTPMTRAILSGQKTQTRRLVKPQPKDKALLEFRDGILSWGDMEAGTCYEYEAKAAYQPGDILYVRETWAENTIPHSGNYAGIEYRADYYGGKEPILRWRPSIHMPREAARIFLRVTDVRVERLKSMSADDGFCEGFTDWDDFVRVWNSTIKPSDLDRYGWNANPWVWVYTFERCEKEDAE